MKEKIPLQDLIKYVLEEARIVLPGVQAFFGFQLIAVFNQRFKELDPVSQYIHLGATFLTLISVALVLTPAAYHRQVEPDRVSTSFIKFASTLLCISLFPLILSMGLDSYVITKLVTNNNLLAVLAAVPAFLVPIYFWYYIPQRERAHHKRLGPETEHTPLHHISA